MRRAFALILAACAVAGGVLLATSGRARREPRSAVAAAHTRVLTTCASSGCGAYAATLQWSQFSPWGHNTSGYNVFLNGARVGSTAQQSWTFSGMACGTAFRLGVQAHDSGSDASKTVTASYMTPLCPKLKVGAPTPVGVICTQTLDPGADVESALASASPGAVVCLNSGNWSAITLISIAPASPGVTLAATPGQAVVVPGFTITGSNTRNLTIEGFDITVPGNVGQSQGGTPNNGIQLLCGISGGVTFAYNTIEHQPTGDGIYVFAGNCGSGHTQTGVTFEYNQIDHVSTGLEIDGGRMEEYNFSLSHNVIGPYIQDGGYGHYIQVQGISGFTVDHNAFEGPADASYEKCLASGSASHLNVLHIDTGQTNVTFDNNIVWHAQACGDTVLIQDSPMNNIRVDNNLDVEDPACDNNDSNGCQSVPYLIVAPHGLTFEHNTSVNAARGITLGYIAAPSYTDPNNMTAEYNITAPSPGAAEQDNYGFWHCASSCTTRNNVSADTSADTVLGGTGNVVKWTPSWTTTSWTPVSGPGYQPPPTGYYQPTGLSISGAGYGGHLGP